MKNLTEKEMVSVNGGFNWDAWSNGYNCLQCRAKGGSAINCVIIVGLATLVSNVGGALAGLFCGKIFGDAYDDAMHYCPLCIDDVRE